MSSKTVGSNLRTYEGSHQSYLTRGYSHFALSTNPNVVIITLPCNQNYLIQNHDYLEIEII